MIVTTYSDSSFDRSLTLRELSFTPRPSLWGGPYADDNIPSNNIHDNGY